LFAVTNYLLFVVSYNRVRYLCLQTYVEFAMNDLKNKKAMSDKAKMFIALPLSLSLLLSCSDWCHNDSLRDEHRLMLDTLLRVDQDAADSLLSEELRNYPLPPNDSVDYCRLLQQCAVAAFAKGDWELSDSLTDCVRAYGAAHACDCDCRLPELIYRNETTTALCAIYSGRLDRAIAYMESARRATYQYKLTAHYYDVAINIADMYIQANRLPEAAENLRHGLYLCDSLSLSETSKVPFYNALSTIYLHLGDYSSALYYSDQAMPCLSGASALDRFSFWCDRGNVYYMREEYEQALQCFDSCRVTSVDVSDYNAYIARLNSTDVRVLLGQFDGVDEVLDSCRQYFDANKLATCNYYLNTLNARLLLLRDDDADGAVHLLQHSADEGANAYLRYLRQSLLHDCYERIGCADSIVSIDEAMIAYKDSLLNNVAAMRVADVELRYKENIRATKLLSRQHELEKNIFIAILLVVVLILVVVISWSYYLNMRRKRALEYEQLRHGILKEKVKSLRMRISPHYLMNLAHLLGQSEQTDEEGITLTLRRCLELSSRTAVTLTDEITFVKGYLALLPQMRDVEVQWVIADDIHPDEVLIPGMSLQLPLENAVKYAYPPTQQWPSKVIRVEVHRKLSGTEIVVEDFGVGLTRNGASKPSTGFTILTKTVSYLNMRNKESMDINIVDKSKKPTSQSAHGVKVTLFVPDGYDFLDE
jgi:tetratricopeptide (TPR) repeat protein